jgi:hypothetical protein
MSGRCLAHQACERAAVAVDQGGDGRVQRSLFPGLSLQFDEDQRAAVDRVQDLAEGRHGLTRILQAHGAELIGGVRRQPPQPADHPLEALVMEHHHYTVGRQAHIEFDPIAPVYSRLERGQGILRRALGAPEPPMCDRRLQQLPPCA